MSKRQFLDHAANYPVGGVTAAAVLESLQPNYALAQQVVPDDPAIETETAEHTSPQGNGTVRGLMAWPAGAEGPLPAVLVVHENRGLNPYIEDVVRRLGKAGYLALGPDGLTSRGGYPGDDERGREMQSSLDPAKLMADFFAGFEHLVSHERSTRRVGAVGFCYGGRVCNALAVVYPNLAASVPYYGRQADAADVPESRRRCSSTMPGLTRGSMPAGRPTRRRWWRTARSTRRISTRARTTASTTTPRRATTRRRRSWRGRGRWTSSRRTSPRRRRGVSR
jgi:carboxymethylenebutenolidase